MTYSLTNTAPTRRNAVRANSINHTIINLNRMDTIDIILAVVIFLVLLGTWDNSGRIDRLQRRAAVKVEGEKRGTEKNLLGIISEMEKEIEAKDQEIKSLKAELNKVKFDYACEVAGKK